MKLPIVNQKNEPHGNRALPLQFEEAYRPDLIHRAFVTQRSNERQPYGSDPEAGQRHSSKLSRRRRNYRGAYGMGISRSPRKITSRRGRRLQWAGATAPYTRGGRRAHPPTAEKSWERKINAKELKKALRSAMTATITPLLVEQRGHRLPKDYPFIIASAVEQVSKTKDVLAAFQKWNIADELARAAVKKIRAGKGRKRGRKYKQRIGPLLVVSQDCPLVRAGGNIPGVDVIAVPDLDIQLLAPGGVPGRLTFWTEKALEKIEQGKLFL